MALFLDQNNIFYHGTRAEFEKFRPLSHFGSFPAAQECALWPYPKTETLDVDTEYSTTNFPPFTNALEQTASGFAKKIIPVHLNMKQTYEIHDFAGVADINYFRCEFLYHIVHNLKMTQIPKFYDYIFTEPFKMCITDVIDELGTDNLYKNATGLESYRTPDELNRYHLYQQRMIQYFEHLGYDGFNYTNRSEDRGHTSYIVFRPENIVRMDRRQQITENKPLKIVQDYNPAPYREMVDFEQKLLNKTESFHNISDNLKKQIWTDAELYHRPSVIKSAIRARKYYTNLLFTEILPKIENIGTQPKYGYHGLYTHTAQVAQFAIELAISVGTDPLPVLLGAALHDIAREPDHDGDDYTHGPRGAEIARDFLNKNYPNLFPGTIDKIVYAIANHTQREPQIAPDLISACIWDADRIRLSWEMGYEEKYYNTEYGKYLASLPYRIHTKRRLNIWPKLQRTVLQKKNRTHTIIPRKIH